MDTPASIEEAVSETVIRRLETALGDRGLLLSADELTAAEADAAQQGSRLLGVVIDRCYPEHRHAGATFEFDSDRAAARLAAALEFGAVTARVLARGELGGSVELLCAIFNLGIGLVDGICDDDAETGGAVLELVQRQDLVQASEGPRPRGWLRDTLPTTLAEDHTVAFTVDIIEVFFETLHAVYPDDAWLHLRRRVGAQLRAALEAERESVAGAAGRAGRERLIECSRLTSVLPFQIIEALAGGGHADTEPTAGDAARRGDVVDRRSGRPGPGRTERRAERCAPHRDRRGRDCRSRAVARLDRSRSTRPAGRPRASSPGCSSQAAVRPPPTLNRRAGRSCTSSSAMRGSRRGRHDSATASVPAVSITSSNSASSTGRSVSGGM